MIIIKSKFLRRIPDKIISKYGVMIAVVYIQSMYVKVIQRLLINCVSGFTHWN